MSTHDDVVDDRLRDAMRQIAQAAPTPPPIDTIASRQCSVTGEQRPLRSMLVAAAAIGVLGFGGLALLANRDNPSASSDSPEQTAGALPTTTVVPIETEFVPVFRPSARAAETIEHTVDAYLDTRFPERVSPFGLIVDWQPIDTARVFRQGDSAAVQVRLSAPAVTSIYVGVQRDDNGWFVFAAGPGGVADGLGTIERREGEIVTQMGLVTTDRGAIEIADAATGLAFADANVSRADEVPTGPPGTSEPTVAPAVEVVNVTLRTDRVDNVTLRWHLWDEGADQIDYFGEVAVTTDGPSPADASAVLNQLAFGPPSTPAAGLDIFAPLGPNPAQPFTTEINPVTEHPDVRIVSVNDTNVCIEAVIGDARIDGCGDIATIATGLEHSVFGNTGAGTIVFGVVPDDVDLVEVGGEPVEVIGNVWLTVLDTPEPRDLVVTDLDTGATARLEPAANTNVEFAVTTTTG